MKKKFSWLFLGIILLLVVYSVIAVLLLQKSEFDKKNNHVYLQELDINSDLVQKLYKTANPSYDGEILKGLYADGNPKNAYILAMGAMSYIRDNISIDDPAFQNMMFTATLEEKQLKNIFMKFLAILNIKMKIFMF